LKSSRPKWAIFISGRGSNLAALLDLRDQIEIKLVVSSQQDAYGLKRARRAGLPTLILEKKINWDQLETELRARRVNAIFLAGFMRIVPKSFIDAWPGQILNLHPSLLPAYKGLDSIARAYADAADIGVSIHQVTPGVDEGPVILQRRCLNAASTSGYSFDQVEMIVHMTEQRLVREAVLKWKV